MQIKVFKAGNMKDAMTAMKSELGEDAVILHSKKYKEGGILGIGSREVVEITAAVEETSLPKKAETLKLPRPTILSRYKTDGTAQGVAEAERAVENLSEENTDEPRQMQEESSEEKPSHPLQIDELAKKFSEQKDLPAQPKSFEGILQNAQEDSALINLSAPEGEIISEPIFDYNQPVEKPAPVADKVPPVEKPAPVADKVPHDEKPAPVADKVPHDEKPAPVADKVPPVEKPAPVADKVPPVEKPAPVADKAQSDEKPAPVADKAQSDEKSAPVADKVPPNEKPAPVADKAQSEEKPAPVADKVQPVDKKPAPVDKAQPVDKKPAPVDKAQPVDKKPAPVDKVQPVDKKPVTEKNLPQQNVVFTQEQMAQTQAMIMAQFNQMQMMQQAAIAQAQAQAAEQIRLQQAAQAQQASLAKAQPATQNEEKIKRLEEEIAQMKALLAEVLGRESKKGTISLHEALKLQEVDEDILKEMAAQTNPGDTLVDIHETAAKATLTNYLTEHLKFSDGVKLNRHGVRIVALLGTTGVGKTTTLAKIAAKFVLEQRTNVALITADTYRISAVEQLKTYSDILELPLEIVYNPPELASAIDRHRNKELILIDTAGRSQHNEYQMRELEEFLRVNPRIEKHLVISATTKFTDARQIMSKFSQIAPDKIIFTKIDETGSLGMIVNLLHDSKYSLSYITTGQSVPDDIERANAELLTNFLLEKVEED